MKRVLLAFFINLLVLGIKCAGQTVRMYEVVCGVTKEGIKYESNGCIFGTSSKYVYLTFTNNNALIYSSDKYGNQINGLAPGPWRYQGVSNGRYTYYDAGRQGPYVAIPSFYPYLYSSKDFKRINIKKPDGHTYVLEERNPQDIGVPDTFY